MKENKMATPCSGSVPDEAAIDPLTIRNIIGHPEKNKLSMFTHSPLVIAS